MQQTQFSVNGQLHVCQKIRHVVCLGMWAYFGMRAIWITIYEIQLMIQRFRKPPMHFRTLLIRANFTVYLWGTHFWGYVLKFLTLIERRYFNNISHEFNH
jgi:hypothetical protein